MITKDDIIKKCGTLPGLRPFGQVIGSRDFTEAELEAIDFIIEAQLSMNTLMNVLKETMVAKLEIWLSSTKDTDSPT